VCGHLGYLPQTADGPGLKAKTSAAALQLIEDSLALERAGAGMIVYELIPEEVAAEATCRLEIPTIGIGAGRYVDGQVLLWIDLLGITPIDFIHNLRFKDLRVPMIEGLASYAQAVRDGSFPGAANVRHLPEGENEELMKVLGVVERRRVGDQ
jgi:3-methyl-2-oxobutanoate hydroxymethyltransferase